jgi:hypothetical protein
VLNRLLSSFWQRKVLLHEREMYSYHDTRFNAGMIEIRPHPMSIAKRRVQTPAFDVLSTISPFRAVNDCKSFNIDRIGQPMC